MLDITWSEGKKQVLYTVEHRGCNEQINLYECMHLYLLSCVHVLKLMPVCVSVRVCLVYFSDMYVCVCRCACMRVCMEVLVCA